MVRHEWSCVRPKHTIAVTPLTLPPTDLAHVLDNVRHWDKLRGKRVFITGASGFVGTWLTESFAWANENLSLSACLTEIPRNEIPGGDFDYGIHAAKAPDFDADVAGTRRILDFSIERGVSRLLFTSSGAIYGVIPLGMANVQEEFSEVSDPPHAGTGYAQAKRAGESLCAQYAQQFGLCAVVGRLFAFTGPALPLNANFAVGNFVRDVLAGGPVSIQGDGTARRSYLYAADLAIWLWTLLLAGESARPYNVGSPDAVSIEELAQAVVANTQPGTGIVKMGYVVPGAGSVYVPSVQRAREELQLEPLISLGEGIRRMYAWHLPSKAGEMLSSLPTTY